MISTLLFVNNSSAEQQLVNICLKKIKENVYLIPAYCSADVTRILSIVKPDAIILDVPELNAYDAIMNNGASDSSNKIPLFIFTEHTIYQKAASTLAADGIYTKPTTDEEYKNILDKIISSLN